MAIDGCFKQLSSCHFLVLQHKMFEKTLPDLVKGIRAAKNAEGKFVQQAILEIRAEVQQPDIRTKANAVEKLIYVR